MELLDSRIDFTGCKIALICDGQILTILRDDKPTIPWPNLWEFSVVGKGTRVLFWSAWRVKSKRN